LSGKRRWARRLLIGVLVLAGLVLLFDGVVAILSWSERRGAEEVDPWVLSSQLLEPRGAPRGTVVMVHGFAGSPLDLRPLAEPLRGEGYRVVIPLVPGQTRTVSAYDRGDIPMEEHLEWLRAIIREETARAGTKPALVGFSMGGALSTVVASEGLVSRLLLLAPFYGLPAANDLAWTSSRVLSVFVPVVPKFVKARIDDPEGYETYTPGSELLSLSAFHQLERLAEVARAAVPKIAVPTLVLAAEGDSAASFETIMTLYSEHPVATVRALPDSNHVVLYDYDREVAIAAALEFLTTED